MDGKISMSFEFDDGDCSDAACCVDADVEKDGFFLHDAFFSRCDL
jgi:hypothetical protein